MFDKILVVQPMLLRISSAFTHYLKIYIKKTKKTNITLKKV